MEASRKRPPTGMLFCVYLGKRKSPDVPAGLKQMGVVYYAPVGKQEQTGTFHINQR